MGLLSRKPKVTIEECCKQFYDSSVFGATVGDLDVWSEYLNIVSKSVTEVDQSFSLVDPNLFRQEMTALRMELFGLACSKKLKREELALRDSFFTKRYLEDNGKLDIWDIMGEYNQAIAQSANLTERGEPMAAGRVARMHVTRINVLRFEMFKKWAEAHIGDPNSVTEEDNKLLKCVTRVTNRIGADIRRADCIAVWQLAGTLTDRIGYDVNQETEALFRLAATIFGFYKGAEDYLKSVNLQKAELPRS